MVKVDLLHTQLANAGLPVVSVFSNGVVIYGRVLTSEETVLAASIVSLHNPAVLSPSEQDELEVSTAKMDFRQFPDWATWTPQQASDYVNDNILSGMDKVAIDAWIDTNVTSLTTAKTALKLLAEAIVDIRGVLKAIARAVIFLRIIAVRRN